MTRIGQALSALFVIVLGGAGLTTIFAPLSILEPGGFGITTDYGMTNLRTLGAPTLALGIITAIGTYKKDWWLILPASFYFFFNFSARIVSLVQEGYEDFMVRGMFLTFGLFVLSQVAIYLYRKSEAGQQEAQA